jgi:hypothetical protein
LELKSKLVPGECFGRCGGGEDRIEFSIYLYLSNKNAVALRLGKDRFEDFVIPIFLKHQIYDQPYIEILNPLLQQV